MSERGKPTDGYEAVDGDERPDVADLARGANGLGAEDAEAALREMMDAQVEMMTAVAKAQTNFMTASFKAMAGLWGLGLGKARKDTDRD